MANVEVPGDGGWQWLLWQASDLNGVPAWAKTLAQKLGQPASDGARERTERAALGRLVELRRREQAMTAECLADRAGVELAELLAVEAGARDPVEPRTVFMLAEVLGLPVRGLMQLAGLVEIEAELSEAAARFAARLRPTSRLSREEREALVRFVGVLRDP